MTTAVPAQGRSRVQAQSRPHGTPAQDEAVARLMNELSLLTDQGSVFVVGGVATYKPTIVFDVKIEAPRGSEDLYVDETINLLSRFSRLGVRNGLYFTPSESLSTPAIMVPSSLIDKISVANRNSMDVFLTMFDRNNNETRGAALISLISESQRGGQVSDRRVLNDLRRSIMTHWHNSTHDSQLSDWNGEGSSSPSH